MMLGMSGVGKSALINRLLGEDKAPESAFGDADGNKIREYSGDYKGITLKLIDTPGLEATSAATAYNRNVLKKVQDRSVTHQKADRTCFLKALFKEPRSWTSPVAWLHNDASALVVSL